MMKRCDTCKHGIVEGEGEARRVTCTLIPPTPVVTVKENQAVTVWLRPVMKPDGWCGQHDLSWPRWLFNGTRA